MIRHDQQVVGFIELTDHVADGRIHCLEEIEQYRGGFFTFLTRQVYLVNQMVAETVCFGKYGKRYLNMEELVDGEAERATAARDLVAIN